MVLALWTLIQKTVGFELKRKNCENNEFKVGHFSWVCLSNFVNWNKSCESPSHRRVIKRKDILTSEAKWDAYSPSEQEEYCESLAVLSYLEAKFKLV